MPVDRSNRDDTADALAAYMRGETTRGEFRAKVDAILRQVKNNPAKDERLRGHLLWELTPGLGGRDDWQYLRRKLAFLRSDLEDSKIDSPSPKSKGEDPTWPEQVRLARWHLLSLLPAAGLGYFVGWWFLLVASFISFIVYQRQLRPHLAAWEEVRNTELRQVLAFAPFANEAEWKAHERLLEQYRLPDEDARLPPQPLSYARKVLNTFLVILAHGAIGLMFGFMYAWSVVFWPIFLVLMAPWSRRLFSGDSRLNSDAPRQ